MKKTIYILFLLPFLLFASQKYELKLYESIFLSIFKDQNIKVYADKESLKLLQGSSMLTTVEHCNEATTLLLGKEFEKLPEICKNKPIFATNYMYYQKMPNAFGVFYWRKGRPQIKFKKSTLLSYHLKLPDSLRKYAK